MAWNLIGIMVSRARLFRKGGVASLLVAAAVLTGCDAVGETSGSAENGETGPVVTVQLKPNQKTVDVVGLTHLNDGAGKRVTYTEPRVRRVQRSEFDPEVWTIEETYSDVLCFADGNNAVFFTIDGEVMAANGKARQFVNYEEGDGILLSDKTRQPVRELPRGQHVALVSKMIGIGLELCGQKDLAGTAQAAAAAVKEPVIEADKQDVYLNVTMVFIGAEDCGFTIESEAIGDYLRANDIDNDTLRAESIPLMVMVQAAIDADPRKFCTSFFKEFGPDGYGFVSK